jgi:serine/threonine-protein kinase HipA
VNRLAVWVEGTSFPIGWLESDDRFALSFAYSGEWLERRDAYPLSHSLPFSIEPFGDSTTRTYFENLLPESDTLLRATRRKAGLEERDLCGLLALIGADVAGAVSCLPPDLPPVKSPGNLGLDYDPIDNGTLVEIVARLGERLPLPLGISDKSAVAGVQSKLSLARLPDGRFAQPKLGTGAPTTHILKIPYLDQDRTRPNVTIPREALYEATCARLAHICGLETAATESRWIGQYEAVISARFDRHVTPEGNVHRIHQEDFAQALGLDPVRKYQRYATASQSFSAGRVASLLNATGLAAQSVDQFLLATFFNLAIGNADNHAKNHALLYSYGPIPVLAPLYDLVPTRINPDINTEFAFRIGNSKCAEEMTRDDLYGLLEVFGRRGKAADRFLNLRVTPMLDTLEHALATLHDPWLIEHGFVTYVRSESARVRQCLAS